MLTVVLARTLRVTLAHCLDNFVLHLDIIAGLALKLFAILYWLRVVVTLTELAAGVNNFFRSLTRCLVTTVDSSLLAQLSAALFFNCKF